MRSIKLSRNVSYRSRRTFEQGKVVPSKLSIYHVLHHANGTGKRGGKNTD